VTDRRRLGVAVARAREPPAADLDGLRRIPHVDDLVELVVLLVPRLEVGGAARTVDVAAVDEPEMVGAPRVRSRPVEEADRARAGGILHVEELDAGGGEADAARLVRD